MPLKSQIFLFVQELLQFLHLHQLLHLRLSARHGTLVIIAITFRAINK